MSSGISQVANQVPLFWDTNKIANQVPLFGILANTTQAPEVKMSMFWNPVTGTYQRCCPALSPVKRQPLVVKNQPQIVDKDQGQKQPPVADENKPPVGTQKQLLNDGGHSQPPVASQSRDAQQPRQPERKQPLIVVQNQPHNGEKSQPLLLKRQPLMLKRQPPKVGQCQDHQQTQPQIVAQRQPLDRHKRQPPTDKSQPPSSLIQPRSAARDQPRKQPQDVAKNVNQSLKIGVQRQPPVAAQSQDNGVQKQPLNVQPLNVGMQCQSHPPAADPGRPLKTDVQVKSQPHNEERSQPPDLPPDPDLDPSNKKQIKMRKATGNMSYPQLGKATPSSSLQF